MTLATRCPACGTAFRVVSDQLRVSSGWVRCGRCGSSFDALEHLFRHASARRPAPGGGPPEASSAAALPDPLAAGDAPPVGAGPEPPVQEFPRLEPATADEAEVAPTPVDVAPAESTADEAAPRETLATDPPPSAPAPLGETMPAPVEETVPAGAQETAPAAAEETKSTVTGEPVAGEAEEAAEAAPADPPLAPVSLQGAPAPAPPAAPSDLGWARQSGYRPGGRPSFLRRAEAAARWSHPATRTTLALLLAVLGLVLVAQAALLWRDEIALRWPATRATLQAACAALQCRIEAPRRIQSLDVLSSALLSEPDGATYRLELTIRNRGTIEALAPAIELTLTDTGGRLFARRVLTLAELGLPERAIGPGQELPVRAELVTGSAAVAGYNIALFYP